MRDNTLKKTLKAGEFALGTLVWDTKSRGAIHTLAQAGMDFIMICTEHSSYNLETVVDLVTYAHAAGITPVVRIPDLEYEHVTRLLDSGCQSLIVPHVKTGAEVQRFIEMAKYLPGLLHVRISVGDEDLGWLCWRCAHGVRLAKLFGTLIPPPSLDLTATPCRHAMLCQRPLPRLD